jgi:hypothetical protein
MITNRLEDLQEVMATGPAIAKPVTGGGYCQRLSAIINSVKPEHGTLAAPAIVQPELAQPELRVYSISGCMLAFRVISDALDYRSSPDWRLELVERVPKRLTSGLQKLMRSLDLDFAAADFKACPATGELLFLEINSAPMFAAFDRVSSNAISRAIAAFLLQSASTNKEGAWQKSSER